jgi:hypothetical protein
LALRASATPLLHDELNDWLAAFADRWTSHAVARDAVFCRTADGRLSALQLGGDRRLGISRASSPTATAAGWAGTVFNLAP